MIILCLKTDQPAAYLGIYDDDLLLEDITWEAHRELSNTIYTRLKTLLDAQKLSFKQIAGIVCFKGPGSFTGLRIGLTAANALAYTGSAAIVATSGDDWISGGIKLLLNGQNEKIVLPHYGADANITLPTK